jgi:FSR family fosmidomycin resistance protein-like MFS transporter
VSKRDQVAVSKNVYSYLLMLSHICADLSQGALPAILPFLVAAGNINYTSAAGLIFAANCVASIIQPIFGHLGDRRARPWFIYLGIFLANSGLAAIGYLNNRYWPIFFAVMISGVGAALFHPEASRLANLVSGKRKGAGMSNFTVGGNIGFALGPIVATAAITAWGLKGSTVLMLPGLAMPVALFFYLRRLPAAASGGVAGEAAGVSGAAGAAEAAGVTEAAEAAGTVGDAGVSGAAGAAEAAGMAAAAPGVAATAAKDNWPAFSRLTLAVFCRSIMSYGMMTFIPLYWVDVLGQTKTAGNLRLTVFSATAAVATIVGGRLADRYGFNRVIRGSFAFLPALLLLFSVARTPWVATLVLLPIAFAISCPASTLVVLGQEFLPNRLGMSAGITLGLGITVGGMVTPGLGWLSDHYGLLAAIYGITAATLLGVAGAWLIPKRQPGQS